MTNSLARASNMPKRLEWGEMLSVVCSFNYRKIILFSRPKQIESFINKLLEQPFCHYQTENNIQFPTENVSFSQPPTFSLPYS